MFGCMLMHGAMGHDEHAHSSPFAAPSIAAPAPVAGGQTCPHCGYPLAKGFAFCPNCGMSLRTAKCPACGQKVDPNWSACAYCGSPLGDAA